MIQMEGGGPFTFGFRSPYAKVLPLPVGSILGFMGDDHFTRLYNFHCSFFFNVSVPIAKISTPWMK